MKLLDLTFTDPAENLACDELLLNRAEQGEGPEIIRFWESHRYFIVLGYSRPVGEDVDSNRCEQEGVPILRRASGGGTVLQGPGCLNYALILNIRPGTPFASITGTTREILSRLADALAPLLHSEVHLMGDSDLTIRGRKFSGNAQRRLGRALLFHGTLLCRFDLERANRLLHLPNRQPEYRNRRGHLEFMANCGIEASTAKEAMRSAWNVGKEAETVPPESLVELVKKRYGRPEWTFRI